LGGWGLGKGQIKMKGKIMIKLSKMTTKYKIGVFGGGSKRL
jgi:hypothetical protein